MRQLYFRIIFGVLAILILAFSLPTIFFQVLGRKGPRPEISRLMTGPSESIRNRFDLTFPFQLERRLDSLGTGFGNPQLRADAASRLRPRGMPPQRAGLRLVSSSPTDSRGILSPRLQRAGRMLAIGPAPIIRRPNLWFTVAHVSVVLAIVGFAGFLMIAPLVRNLRLLEMATSRFGNGDLDSRADVKSRDAVGSVAQQFNLMADSISRLIQRERQLLQSVSHELRTPIARVRFSLDLLGNAETEEERKRRMQEIDGEISEIDHLVGELLDYNRVHSEAMQPNRQSLPAKPLLEEVTKRIHDFRPEIDVQIAVPADEECLVFVDRLLFRRAMQNLLANAIRYARSRVVVSLAHREKVLVVEVSDDGPGVSLEERERIMRPFCQGSDTLRRESGGVGLGLAIVRRIVELHGGSISVRDSESGGARFVTEWPDIVLQSEDPESTVT